jgi:hypothetical protein
MRPHTPLRPLKQGICLDEFSVTIPSHQTALSGRHLQQAGDDTAQTKGNAKSAAAQHARPSLLISKNYVF